MGNGEMARENPNATVGGAPSKTMPNLDEAIIPALMHRSFNSKPYNVVAAKGVYLTLGSGQRIIDACGGAAVTSIGHGNEEVLEAVCKQMTKVSYLHSLTYTTDAAEQLAHFLVHGPGDASKHGLERVFLVNSGSEAVESALKLAVQFFWEKGEPNRTKVVARKQGYHGNTIGAMNVSSNLPRKVQYPCFQLQNISWVSPAYAYQYAQPNETENQFTARLLDELEQHFISLGPENVVAFIAEPIVGATSACTPAPKGYFKGVRQICDKYSILLILDEIMCGMGRTGSVFAFEQEGIVPDIVAVGKGLGGGYSPIAGVFVHKKVVDVLKSGSGYFNHGQTYQAHPVCCAATLAVQRIIHRENLVWNCAQKGKILHKFLLDTFSDRKYVGNIRGRGLFWGIEFVQDKATRQSFAPITTFGARFQTLTFGLGVAIYPGAGTVDGVRGDHAIVAPPYNVTESELMSIVEAMSKAYVILEKEVDGNIRNLNNKIEEPDE